MVSAIAIDESIIRLWIKMQSSEFCSGSGHLKYGERAHPARIAVYGSNVGSTSQICGLRLVIFAFPIQRLLVCTMRSWYRWHKGLT